MEQQTGTVPDAVGETEGARLREVVQGVSERSGEALDLVKKVQVALFGQSLPDEGSEGPAVTCGLVGDAADSLHNTRMDLISTVELLNQILAQIE